jgi:hypothetical protein
MTDLPESTYMLILASPVLVVDFFNHVNMLYGTISEFCTPTEVS